MVGTNASKVLITGVAGFIGRHVADSCLRMGMDVVGLDDLSGGFLGNVPEGVRFVRGDVSDDSLVRSLTETERFDFIYHIAAYAAEGLSHFIRRFNYMNNLVGSVTLINAAIRTKVRCFVFTSSIAVYGKNQLPMHEEQIPTPEDPYGISKYAAELDLKSAHEMFGMNYIIFRPHNVYGEYQNIADRYRNVVGIFMNQVLQGKPMTIFGDGLQSRAFSYIGDVAPVIARSPLNPSAYNEAFNIGADSPCTVLELAREVADAFGVAPQVVHLESRNEVIHAYATHEKLGSIFHDLTRPTSFRDGIRIMADWVKRAGSREPVVFDNVEVTDNLPPSWAGTRP
ncbi:MAG: NAD-dependent epimerase/dehydratase family protein [Anaerolineales bacterium]|nr:NAD-dependent epimerase/dehydratase family protein [Anaerolineales bacterium]